MTHPFPPRRASDLPFFAPDATASEAWSAYIDGVRKKGSSAGAVVEVVAHGVPPGLGSPVYDKLDADLAKAMMSINAVKGVEIGAGFGAARLSGEENADEMRMTNDGRSEERRVGKDGGRTCRARVSQSH